jgi:hypothetical protein
MSDTQSLSRPPLETSAAVNLDAARIARIRAMIDVNLAAFDRGIAAIDNEITQLRAARTRIATYAEKLGDAAAAAAEEPQITVNPRLVLTGLT